MTLWFCQVTKGGRVRRRNLDREPLYTVCAYGIGDCFAGEYWLEEDGVAGEPSPEKPPYLIPTMDEVRAVTWNGFTVASTFSGCGGSCLGYRMAGFRVLWANEFVPAAQAAYLANANHDCHLDVRDVAKVQPEEALEAMGLEAGELDLLDGSPPCQAFSTAGKRERGWGEEKSYEGGGRQLNETLFDQYVRLLRGIKPRTFVAENVSGLVKGAAKGWFLEILAGLKASGYRVGCRLLDAKWLGVPQSRQRVIFVGVREDIDLEPAFPSPLPYLYTLRDALPWIRSVGYHRGEVRPGSKWCPHNRDFRLDKDACGTIRATVDGNFEVVDGGSLDGYEGQKLDLEAPSPCVRAGRPWNEQEVEADAGIEGYAIGREFDKLCPGETSKKYFSLVRPAVDKPSPTIQASHGSRSTAGVTHPTEKRKFTIEELKRVCAFPADFALIGSYAQRWERLGNSVPPLMMRAIAEVVRDQVLVPARDLGGS